MTAGGGKRGRPRDERALYAVLVQTWNHHYGWSAVGRSRFDDPRNGHTETLTVTGTVIYPEAFRHPKATVILSASDHHKEEERAGEYSTSIGTIDARDDLLQVWAQVPAEHMGQLASVAASGGLKIAQFTGTPLKRRRGTISHVSVSTEDEWGDATEQASAHDLPDQVPEPGLQE